MNVLDTFIDFLADKEAWDMYITGAAGTGKTTQLSQEVQYCIDNGISYIVCAYTHKACGILRDKLPEGALVTTLHSFLKKRPTINQHATDKKYLQVNTQSGAPKQPVVMFLDEYSMVGEKDGLDILALQDPDYEGAPSLKVVWLGDKNQLDAIGDIPYVVPTGKYNVKLTTIYRQAGDNPLLEPLSMLVDMIEGKRDVCALPANSSFIRGQDIVKAYKPGEDCVLLAYTNQRVEELNAAIQKRKEPKVGDWLFSPTTKRRYEFLGWVKKPEYIDTPFNGELHLGSKYETLEYLTKTKNCQFAEARAEDDEVLTIAVVFGHYQYKLKTEELKSAAANSNREIETTHRGYKAAAWAKANPKNKLARARAKAWRDFLSFDECVICVDFVHAMTVHKSQGSTYGTVYVDTDDLYRCASINLKQYLKLMYVALSRASGKVITN
ncbi:putative DNA helicase [Edwardsiella phage ETP-1]|uniref:Putative DNA helicase n=3 Tax=Kafunavirus KF1 TaxID=1982588 RepID=A0A6G5P4J8_9CAUD|nr:Dda-like helicase [Edwardsiella phage KF-1]QBP07019.1 putative DNA helicase [Edwardsiella phage ETP-1]UIS54075.1 putative DNA helicase [Edwardsiella phage vB_EpP_ZHX]BAM63069.1 putative DNA helicase [Edwardsiella phage KF-1]BAM63118.1 putative DNA helicase [Edwardsiella phage IW-1]